MREEVLDQLFDDREEIWEFIHEKFVVQSKYTRINEDVWNDFIKTKEVSLYTAAELQEYYESSMMPTLHKALIDDHKILNLYKVLRLRFSLEIEQFFQYRTKAKLKTRNEILYGFSMPANVFYQQPNVSISPKPFEPNFDIQKEDQVPGKPAQKSNKMNSVDIPARKSDDLNNGDDDVLSNEIIEKMWRHVENQIGKIKNNSFVLTSFWKRFAASEGLNLYKGCALVQYFSSHLQDIWSRNVVLALKLHFMKDLKVKPTDDIKTSLFRVYNIHVELDEEGFVERWSRVNEDTIDRIENDKDRTTLSDDNIPSTSNERRDKLLPRRSILRPTFDYEDASDNDEDAQRVEYSFLQPPPPSESSSVVSSKAENQKMILGRTAFTTLDHLEMANFLYDEIFENGSSEPNVIQPKGITIWRKFIEMKNSTKSAVNMSSHYRKWFQKILYTVPLPHEKILQLYKHLKIKVGSEVLSLLEKIFNAKIKLIESFVYSWKFNDAQSQAGKRGRNSPRSSDDSDSHPKRVKGRSPNNMRSPVKSTPRKGGISKKNNETREQEDVDEELISNDGVISESERARFLKHYSISKDVLIALNYHKDLGMVEKENDQSEQLEGPEIRHGIVPKLEPESDGLPEVQEEASSLSTATRDVGNNQFNTIVDDSQFEEDLRKQGEDILKEGLLPISAMKKPLYDEEIQKTLDTCRTHARSKDNYLTIVRFVKEGFQKSINFKLNKFST